MNLAPDQSSNIWHHFQMTLFPSLQQEAAALISKQQQLIEVIEFVQVERHLPELSGTLVAQQKVVRQWLRHLLSKPYTTYPPLRCCLTECNQKLSFVEFLVGRKYKTCQADSGFLDHFPRFLRKFKHKLLKPNGLIN